MGQDGQSNQGSRDGSQPGFKAAPSNSSDGGIVLGKVTVLGAGAWGTAIAKTLADRGHDVALWARNTSLTESINTNQKNERYLPGAVLPKSLRATSDLAGAMDGSRMVVFVVPSHATREVAKMAAPFVPTDVPIVSATKGIENESLMFMDEVLKDELPGKLHNQLAFFSGPSFAKELAAEHPTAVVVASRRKDLIAEVQYRFRTPFLRIYASDDVHGVECGGAMKNVVAIAAGVVDGMGYGHNTRAALVTRGLAEIAKLAVVRGGLAMTVAGLAGIGDLMLTCTGELSRNRTVGVELGKGRKLDEILKSLGHVAEGVKTAKSAFDLSARLDVDMPITREVHACLYEGKSTRQAVEDLMARELSYEFDPSPSNVVDAMRR
ncbi:MAG: NAD(P)H-dependent glycerol-3-phosphate dehydrogenase [Polyangiaceae bacterium]